MADITSNLELYFSMDTSTISGTTITDLSGNGRNGTTHGSPPNPAGKVKQALQFSGSPTKYVNTASAPSIGTGAFTLAFWMKSTSTSGQPFLIYMGDRSTLYGSTYIYLTSTTVMEFGLYGVGGVLQTSATPFFDGNWHHLAAVKSGTKTATLYKDGRQVATGDYAQIPNISGASPYIYLGVQSSYVVNQYVGLLDEVRIYSRALSQADVTALFNFGAVSMLLAHRRCLDDIGDPRFNDGVSDI